jgi:hypothetical protein
MPIFDPVPAGHEIRSVISDLISEYYPDLTEASVSVNAMFVYAARDADGQPKGPAIKHHGCAAYALIKINSLKDRVEGKDDATIFLDGDNYKDWPKETARAILHHEIHHLLVCRDKDGVIKSDDHGRPKLKMRQHDVQIGWFMEIAEQYGSDSIEVQQATMIKAKYGKQLAWSFAEDHAGKKWSKTEVAAPVLANVS